MSAERRNKTPLEIDELITVVLKNDSRNHVTGGDVPVWPVIQGDIFYMKTLLNFDYVTYQGISATHKWPHSL